MSKNIALIIRIITGLVFILSAYSKLIAPGIVEIILVDHGLVADRGIAAVIVRILIGLEFALGILFYLPYLQKKIIIPAALIFLTGFTIYLIYTGYILGDTQNCGCFGTMIEMSPLESIIKNIFLITALIWVYKFTPPGRKGYAVPSLITIVSVILVFIYSPVKSVNDFQFSGYTSFEGKGRVDISEGEKLLAIYNTECDHCQELAKKITWLQINSKRLPEFYALIFTEGTISIDSFKSVTGFNFPYRTIDSNTFFDLIGASPPRIYWLEDGKIKEFWDNDFILKIKSISE